MSYSPCAAVGAQFHSEAVHAFLAHGFGNPLFDLINRTPAYRCDRLSPLRQRKARSTAIESIGRAPYVSTQDQRIQQLTDGLLRYAQQAAQISWRDLADGDRRNRVHAVARQVIESRSGQGSPNSDDVGVPGRSHQGRQAALACYRLMRHRFRIAAAAR
jgi:hypothetical protein